MAMCVMCITLSVLHCDRDNMQLPSFPPRRSSDPAETPGPASRPKHTDAAMTSLPPPAGPACPPGCADRKSTRLNSSHVSISYAVFCMKKKKNRHLVYLSCLVWNWSLHTDITNRIY